jgi:hypothetical protein
MSVPTVTFVTFLSILHSSPFSSLLRLFLACTTGGRTLFLPFFGFFDFLFVIFISVHRLALARALPPSQYSHTHQIFRLFSSSRYNLPSLSQFFFLFCLTCTIKKGRIEKRRTKIKYTLEKFLHPG